MGKKTGLLVVQAIRPEDLSLKLPPAFIKQLLKKLYLPEQLQYLVPYAEREALFLVTHDSIPIAAFIAFRHQGRDLRRQDTYALSVLACAYRHKHKALSLTAILLFARHLQCQDLHYYDETNTHLNLKPYYPLTIRVSKSLYFLPTDPVSFEGDFIFINARGERIGGKITYPYEVPEHEVPEHEASETEAPEELGLAMGQTHASANPVREMAPSGAQRDFVPSLTTLLREWEEDEWTLNLPEAAFQIPDQDTEQDEEAVDGATMDEMMGDDDED